VAANIGLGAPFCDSRALRRAAAAAGADAFVRALPDGYDTVIGDGARRLSPGERRRVGQARALLRDAPLLVLDAPTADLDPAGVAQVARVLGGLRGRRTVLLIAHRDELLDQADRVVVLSSHGRVAETERRAA
jgi:ABC-type multidrug transport system fused ATPase/permease subunit